MWIGEIWNRRNFDSLLDFLFGSNHSTIFHQTLDHVFLPYLNHFHSVSKGYFQNRLDDKHQVVLDCVFRWFLFFPFKLYRKQPVTAVLLLLLDEADSGLKGCSDSTRLLFEISEHPLVFQIFSVVLRIFLIKNFDFKYFKNFMKSKLQISIRRLSYLCGLLG